MIPTTNPSHHRSVTTSPVVAALPGGGWRYECEFEDGSTESAPILAWLVHADGEVVPVDPDTDGQVDDIRHLVNLTKVFHPDEEKTDAGS